MEQYSVLAKYYDALMADVDYEGIADFYRKCFEKYNVNVNSICELGCGTGSITVCLAEKGYQVTGIDISCEMLSVAQKKADGKHLKITFSEQDMTSFISGTECDAVISAFDGVNYLLKNEQVKGCFESVYSSLKDGGLFIFDINTPYKYEKILGDNSFVFELDDMFLSWQSFYNPKQKFCDYVLTFFSENGGVWHRLDEEQRQKAHPIKTLEKELRECGFEILCECSKPDFSEMADDSDRCYFICRKASRQNNG